MGVSIQNMVLMDHQGTLVQPLDHCISGFQSRKGYNELTFTSEMNIDSAAMLCGQLRPEKMAFVVWMDRQKAQDLLEQKTPAGMNPDHEGPLRSLHMALAEVLRVGGDAALDWGVDLLVPKESLDALFGELK